MKKLLFCLSFLLIPLSASAVIKDVTVSYTHEDLTTIHHANLYMNGMMVCSSPDNQAQFTCMLDLPAGENVYTLTVSLDNTNTVESEHSTPVSIVTTPNAPTITDIVFN